MIKFVNSIHLLKFSQLSESSSFTKEFVPITPLINKMKTRETKHVLSKEVNMSWDETKESELDSPLTSEGKWK